MTKNDLKNHIKLQIELVARKQKVDPSVMAKENGLLPLIYPSDKNKKLVRNQNIVYLSVLTQLESEFGSHIAPLKGAHFLRSGLYGLDERSMTDLDILVTQSAHPFVSEYLQNLGYSLAPQSSYEKRAGKRVFRQQDSLLETTIETHTSLFSEKMSESEVRNFSENRSPDLELVYLASHYAYQHNLLKLYWLVDIALFLLSNQVNWSSVKMLAKKYRRINSLDWTLASLQTLGINQNLPPTSVNPVSIETLINPRKRLLDYSLRKLRTRDSFKESINDGLSTLIGQCRKVIR